MFPAIEWPSSDEYPPPLSHSIGLLREQKTYAGAHQQLLFTFGTLLRLMTSVLSARYLRQSETAISLDRLLVSNMRRPALGHHVEFLNACTKATSISWGPTADLLMDLKALLASTERGVSTLLAARNDAFHGARVLSEPEAEGLLGLHLPAFLRMLAGLPSLKQIAVTDGPQPELRINGVPMSWIPLATPGEGPRIGLMEGWDERHQVLKFIDSDRSWETNMAWAEWYHLLKERSLLPTAIDEITNDWLRSRAKAIRPAFSLWPEGHTASQELVSDLMSFPFTNELPARDPWLAVVALILRGEGQGRIVFARSPMEAETDQDVIAEFSETLGMQTMLDDVPSGHPLEALLAEVDLVLLDPPQHDWCTWTQLASSFPGLRLLAVRSPEPSSEAFRGLGTMAGPILAWRLVQAGMDSSTADADSRTWATQLARIHALGECVTTIGHLPASLFMHWINLLRLVYSSEPNRGRAMNLDAATASEWGAVDAETMLALQVCGLLSLDGLGRQRWSDPWARFACWVFALEIGLPLRVALSRLERLETPPDRDSTAELVQVISRRSDSLGEHPRFLALQLALYATRSEKTRYASRVKSMLRTISDPLPAIRQAARCLVSWGRPDQVAILLDSCDLKNFSDADALALARIARSNGSPDTAARLLLALSGSSNKLATRAKHEYAGVLRDKGDRSSRKKAEEVYGQILARSDLALDQRIRSLCGLAENHVNQGNHQEAHALLEKAESLSSAATPDLQATVQHRWAFAHLLRGATELAHARSQAAIQLLPKPHVSALASRVLDVASRIHERMGHMAEADAALSESLRIKRARGDRLGLQKGLLGLSILREHHGTGDAMEPAEQALELATAAEDLLGQSYAWKRLANLAGPADDQRSTCLEKMAELKRILET